MSLLIISDIDIDMSLQKVLYLAVAWCWLLGGLLVSKPSCRAIHLERWAASDSLR